MKIFLCLFLILLSISIVFAQDLPIPKSQLMTKLEIDIASGKINAVDDFWKYAKSKGTPLIETIADDKLNSLVTFVWRGDAETKNVLVQSSFYPWMMVRRQMTQIKNTDIWYKTAKIPNDASFTYQFTVNDPRLPFADPYSWNQFKIEFFNDPLNPQNYIFPKDQENPDDEAQELSLLEMPNAPQSKYLLPSENVKKGKLEKHQFKSAILANERRIWVYTPVDYSPKRKYPTVIFFDGFDYLNYIPTQTILDNLISEGEIPPIVAVFVANPLDDGVREKEFQCNPLFADFAVKELLPWIHSNYATSSEAKKTTLVGLSFGGLASAFIALNHPENFGNVILQSPSLWWGKDYYGEDGEWLTEAYIKANKTNVRFYMEVGTLEVFPSTRKGRPNAFHAVRHFRDVLQLKGNEVYYHEFDGGHEYINWGESLPDALIKILSQNKK
jgi:enterochelin esterase-like enzyme